VAQRRTAKFGAQPPAAPSDDVFIFNRAASWSLATAMFPHQETLGQHMKKLETEGLNLDSKNLYAHLTGDATHGGTKHKKKLNMTIDIKAMKLVIQDTHLGRVEMVEYANYLREMQQAGTPFELEVDNHLKALNFSPMNGWGRRVKTNPHMRAFWMATLSFFLGFLGWFALAPLMPIIRENIDGPDGVNMCDNRVNMTAGGFNEFDEYKVACICKEPTGCKGNIANAKVGSVSSTIFMRLLTGWMLEVMGPVKTQCLMMGTGIFFIIGAAFITNISGLITMMTLLGTLGATFVTNQFWMPLMFAPQSVGLANGTAGGWGNLGAGFANGFLPILYGIIRQSGLKPDMCWRLTLIFPLVCFFIIVPVMYFFSQDTPLGRINMKRDLKKADSSIWDYVACMKDLRVVLLFWHYAACFGTELTMNFELISHYKDTMGMKLELAGIIAFCFGLMNIFARSIGGMMSDWSSKKWSIRGRLWVHFFFLLFESFFLFAFGWVDKDVGVPLSVVFLICFSICVQAAEGTTYAMVPFVLPKNMGIVSALVGAGGNVGAVVGNLIIHKYIPTDEDKLLPFKYHSLFVIVFALSVFLMKFEYDGSMLTKPKLANYCEHGLFAYAIEWKQDGNDMRLVSHYNPAWRRKQAKTGSLYTLDSYHVRMSIDKGVVGRTLKSGRAEFVRNVQKLDKKAFLRANAAKKHNIKSCLFMPAIESGKTGQTTIIEVGCAKELKLVEGTSAEEVAKRLQSKNPASAIKLFQVVDEAGDASQTKVDLGKYCNADAFVYAITWIKVGGEMQAVQHYNPQKRIDEVLKATGEVSMYTTESYGVRMKSGVGLVGKMNTNNPVLFVPNAQALDPVHFLRSELSKKFGIKSVIFMLVDDVIIEVGSTSELMLSASATASSLASALHSGDPAQVMAQLQDQSEK
jgi:NNP family nitrate/nitrite transporter-like MFS transporter